MNYIVKLFEVFVCTNILHRKFHYCFSEVKLFFFV